MKSAMKLILVLTALCQCFTVQAKSTDMAQVDLVGSAAAGDVYLKLTDGVAQGAFGTRLFVLDNQLRGSGLRVAMTALVSTGKVNIESNIDEVDEMTYPVISSISLIDEED